MALVSNRPTISCRRLRPRAYVIALKASLVTSTKQEHQPRPALGDTSHQRTGSYVNWKATAADFFKVLQCLEGVSLAKPHLGAVAALPENPCSQRKHWTGVFEGLFARNGAQQQAEGPEVTLGLEDGTTLTQAVVMFTATWCGPCSMVYRELKLAAGRLAGGTPTAILVVDVDEEKELASELGIKVGALGPVDKRSVSYFAALILRPTSGCEELCCSLLLHNC